MTTGKISNKRFKIMAETETATFMVRLMNNVDVAAAGAAAGFLVKTMLGRNRNQGMGFQ